MNSKVYKWCAVPQCTNTSIVTPNKVFIYVPNKKIIRDKWFKLAQRNPKDVVTNSSIYFCEDHFDLPNDMENYMEYHVMGSVSQVRMKPGCMPKKFKCQTDRTTRTSDTTERPYIAKKRRMMTLQECEKHFEEKSIVTEQSSYEEIASGSSEKEIIIKMEPRVKEIILPEDYYSAATPDGINIKKESLDDDALDLGNHEVTSYLPSETFNYEEIKIEEFDIDKELLRRQMSLPMNHADCEQVEFNLPGAVQNCKKKKRSFVKTFKSKTECSFETKSQNRIYDELFACDMCNYSTKQLGQLNIHKLTHTREKLFTCENCSISFTNMILLEKHILTHTQEKPFKCAKCSYSCKRMGHLKRHQLVHTGEKPFTCEKCNNSFTDKTSLKRHVLIHLGKRPFACDQCSYSGKQMSQLKTHKLIHTGEKPFACDQCSFSCNQLIILKRHKLIHTGEKPFACNQCTFLSNRQSSLKTHKLIHTKDKHNR